MIPNENEKIKKHMLSSEQVFITDEPTQVVTVLSSSVAVCLYDIENGRGGIVNYSIPIWNGIGFKTARYGNIAIEKLIEKFLYPENNPQNLNINKEKIIAKIAGGSVLKQEANIDVSEDDSIGHKNVSVAFNTLQKHNIHIAGSDIGGHVVRYVSFNTHTGTISVKYNFKNK